MVSRLFLFGLAVFFLNACAVVPPRQKPAPVVDAAAAAPPAAPTAPVAPPLPPNAVAVQEVPPPQGVEVRPYEAPPPSEPVPLSAPEPSEPVPAAPAGEAPPLAPADPAPAAPSPEVQTAYVPPAPMPEVAKPKMSAPADALVEESNRLTQERNYSGAAASLERALRIDPRNAYLWNRLAHVRLDQGQVTLAGNLADRSNALAGDSPSLKQDNWAIIALARRKNGDASGAAEAERKARGGS